jgi:hypothetical protein
MAAIATTSTIIYATLWALIVNSMATPARAQGVSNPPWFPSLMAFEHYDSERTKLFKPLHWLVYGP